MHGGWVVANLLILRPETDLWRRPPALNARLVTLSRSMLMLTIFVHVVMSRVFFANWCVFWPRDLVACGWGRVSHGHVLVLLDELN
jgi:hypothetical protein